MQNVVSVYCLQLTSKLDLLSFPNPASFIFNLVEMPDVFHVNTVIRREPFFEMVKSYVSG